MQIKHEFFFEGYAVPTEWKLHQILSIPKSGETRNQVKTFHVVLLLKCWKKKRSLTTVFVNNNNNRKKQQCNMLEYVNEVLMM